MILNLYTANHGKPDGIEDYISLITRLFGDRGIKVKVSTMLDPGAVNLIIDEFTNYLENRRIADFKKAYPNSKIVFILTEFAERKWGIKSFNHFGGIFDSAAIALFDVYLRLVRDDLGRLGIKHCVKLMCYMPVFVTHMIYIVLCFVFYKLLGRPGLLNPIGEYLRIYHNRVYLHMRYLGLKANLHYADAVVTSHEKIIDGFRRDKGADGQPLYCCGVLYPEFDKHDTLNKLMVGKKPFIEITGSVTSYRKRWIEHINYTLMILGLHNVFGYCMSLRFRTLASGKSIKRGAFSLHPPQTRKWPYCSPTRIFRALAVNHNLPILTHHFHQNPIEDVCFVFNNRYNLLELHKMYADRNQLISFIKPRIERYNEIAVARNDVMTEKLKSLIEDNPVSKVHS